MDTAAAVLADAEVIIEHAAIITRCRAILARAKERAWATGGWPVINAIAVLDAQLDDHDRAPCGLAVHAAEITAEHLIAVIERECPGDEAGYVEGDEL